MSKSIKEIPQVWIGLLQEKHGRDAEYFSYLSDIFFAHRWIIRNCKLIQENLESSLVFNINKLHNSSRFKDSKRERVITAIEALIYWRICSKPFKLPGGRCRRQLVCRIKDGYLPMTDVDIETIHEAWLRGWYSHAAS